MRALQWSLLTLLCLATRPVAASTELVEIRQLVSTHLPSLSTNDLAAPTVEDLLARLAPRARWVEAAETNTPGRDPIAGSRRHSGDIGYIRMEEVTGNADARLGALLKELQSDGSLNGLVLDLRFAGGRDFAASARTSALFVNPGQPLLDWGEGVYTAPGTNAPFSLPIAVLVNSNTRGSSEALAATLRTAGRAVVIGGKTAGEAALLRDFPLSTGRILRLAVAPVKTGDGLPIGSDGLAPDILVVTPAETERKYLSDPFAAPVAAATGPETGSPSSPAPPSSQARRRITEAELIRNKRQSLGLPDLPASPSASTPTPAASTSVQDPALARGLDFVTGLNAVRE